MCRQVLFVVGSLALLFSISPERGLVLAEQVRLDVTRDTWLSAVGDESKGANGGAARLKLKSIQELSLIDFDFAKLRGKEIQRCRLFLKQASDIPLDRITLSTLGANWTEGTSTNYAIVNGQSTFTHQSYPDIRWADSDITAVSLGAGSTIWRSLRPMEQEAGWVAYEVPSELVQLCVAGLSPGWLMMDDTGYSRSHRKSTVLYRCDISRPQWERTSLDGLLDYNVVSQSAFREYRRIVLDRKLRNGQTVMVYGSSNPIGASNVQSVAWAWDSWCRGADGILPWQTIGTKQSWEKADELALFYPNPSGPSSPPIPSIRLKAYCYGQQDTERLNGQWRESIPSHRLDRYDWGERFLDVLPLRSISRADSNMAEDAGWSDYGSITPEVFELLRRQLQNE